MINIKNNLKIISAVILAISSAATVLSACGDDTPEVPVETVIGSQGEILGVSVYTEENNSETQTLLYEITTKKSESKDNNKEQKNENINTSVVNGSSDSSETRKMTVRNNSSGITLVSRQSSESTSRVRVTFPPETTQKSTRVAATFGNNGEGSTKHVPVSYKPDNTPKTTKKTYSDSTVKQTQAETTAAKKPVSNEIINEESKGINVVFKNESVEKGNSASIMIQGTPGKKYSIDFYITASDIADYSSLADQTADENGFVTWTFNVPSSCESGNRKIIIKESGSDNYVQTSINIK